MDGLIAALALAEVAHDDLALELMKERLQEEHARDAAMNPTSRSRIQKQLRQEAIRKLRDVKGVSTMDGAEGVLAALEGRSEESLLEGSCIPNQTGRGYHDDETGHPCSPDAQGAEPKPEHPSNQAAGERDRSTIGNEGGPFDRGQRDDAGDGSFMDDMNKYTDSLAEDGPGANRQLAERSSEQRISQGLSLWTRAVDRSASLVGPEAMDVAEQITSDESNPLHQDDGQFASAWSNAAFAEAGDMTIDSRMMRGMENHAMDVATEMMLGRFERKELETLAGKVFQKIGDFAGNVKYQMLKPLQRWMAGCWDSIKSSGPFQAIKTWYNGDHWTNKPARALASVGKFSWWLYNDVIIGTGVKLAGLGLPRSVSQGGYFTGLALSQAATPFYPMLLTPGASDVFAMGVIASVNIGYRVFQATNWLRGLASGRKPVTGLTSFGETTKTPYDDMSDGQKQAYNDNVTKIMMQQMDNMRAFTSQKKQGSAS